MKQMGALIAQHWYHVLVAQYFCYSFLYSYFIFVRLYKVCVRLCVYKYKKENEQALYSHFISFTLINNETEA